MGEAKLAPLRVDLNCRLKLEFHGSNLTSDAGLLAYCELDDALGLTELAGTVLSDLRRGRNARHLLMGLLRQSVYGRLAGYEDVNDADRLCLDSAMRAIVDRAGVWIAWPLPPATNLSRPATRVTKFYNGGVQPSSGSRKART